MTKRDLDDLKKSLLNRMTVVEEMLRHVVIDSGRDNQSKSNGTRVELSHGHLGMIDMVDVIKIE